MSPTWACGLPAFSFRDSRPRTRQKSSPQPRENGAFAPKTGRAAKIMVGDAGRTRLGNQLGDHRRVGDFDLFAGGEPFVEERAVHGSM